MRTEGATKQDLKMPLELENCHALIRELIELVEKQGADIGYLKQRLHNLLREKYGRSSEKLSSGQLQLFAQELEEMLERKKTTDIESGDEKASNANSGAKNGGGGRKPLKTSLLRIPRDYYPSEEEMICGGCNAKKVEIGKEIVEQLDYVPASFRVIQHVTHKFACRVCQEGVVEGKRPEQIHSGGKPTEGLIAQISTAKNADHLPLYRQEQMYQREGVEVSRSSMGRWLDMSAQAAKPVVERMHELLLQGEVIQADETPVLFLDKNRLPKNSKQGYSWTYFGDERHPYVLYDIQPDRTKARPQAYLRDYSNLLLTDGYGGYDWFARERHANCLVHLRRKIEQSLKYDKTKSGIVLAMFSELYRIERELQGASAEHILQLRQAESLPILNRMKELFREWQIKTPPKSTLGIAINYALPRWENLCLFTQHACLRPDTNLVENAIRPIALGRKSWLHVGSEEALETASVHASLVNSCKRLGVNPFLYLRDIFIRLGNGVECVDNLLPDKWVNQNPID
ncbi:MAG TPA: IS66 family transposase [Oculatellaceae cyanobacterium]